MKPSVVGVVLGMLLVAACAGVRAPVDPPQVTLIDLRLLDATVFAQRYGAELRVQNPNPFDLAVEGLACDLWLNGQPFLSGVTGEAFTVPKYGARSIRLEAVGTLAGILRQIGGWERGRRESLRYALKGHLSLAGRAERVPFEEAGEVSLLPENLLGPR